MGIKLGKFCPICNHDNWITIDNSDCFYIWCGECTCEDSEENVNSFTIVKKDFVDNFICEKCGCPRGTFRENDKEMVMICDNCFEKKVVFEKPEITTNNRNKQKPPTQIEEKVSCPKCGSTQIATGARGVNLTFGLFGASKTVNRCQKCGYTWKPHI